MNKTTLLTAGLMVGVAVAFSYLFIENDESPISQQVVNLDAKQVEAKVALPKKQIKAVASLGDKTNEQQTALVDESSYVRAAPPPPISAPTSSNKAKDGNYTTAKAHGHEEVSGEHKKNAPPPPTGAN